MKKKKYARTTFRDIVQVLMLVAAIVIAVFIFKIILEYHETEEIYDGIAEDVIDPKGKDGFPIDVDELLKINGNAVGWLQFPQNRDFAQINYPIVHATSLEEDKFYLHHTFDKKYNFAGCIFSASWETGNFSDVTDDNTILYGHAMNNRSMFGGIKLLRDQNVYNKNDFFYIFTIQKKIYRYHIIGVFGTKDGSDAYTYKFANSESYDKHIEKTIEQSVVKTKLGEQAEPRHMVTLSTCDNISNAGRIVVVAVRESEMSYEAWNEESNK